MASRQYKLYTLTYWGKLKQHCSRMWSPVEEPATAPEFGSHLRCVETGNTSTFRWPCATPAVFPPKLLVQTGNQVSFQLRSNFQTLGITYHFNQEKPMLYHFLFSRLVHNTEGGMHTDKPFLFFFFSLYEFSIPNQRNSLLYAAQTAVSPMPEHNVKLITETLSNQIEGY